MNIINKLIEEADWEKTQNMVGFLFEERELKGFVKDRIEKLKSTNKQKLAEFIDFFTDKDLEKKTENIDDYKGIDLKVINFV